MLLGRRSAKINARRRTIVLDDFAGQSTANRSTIFMNVSNKPFSTRRKSVSSRMTRDNRDDQNAIQQHADLHATNENMVMHETSGLQRSDTHEKAADAVSTTITSANNSTLSDLAAFEEIQFLPSVIVQKDVAIATNISTNLDSDVPKVLDLSQILDLSVPLRENAQAMRPPKVNYVSTSTMPLQSQVNVESDLIRMECQGSGQVLDLSVPKLFEPLAPFCENTQAKRPIPGLIAIGQLNVKKYRPAKKVSNAAELDLGELIAKKCDPTKKKSTATKLILEVLEMFDQPETTVAAEEINISSNFKSDESMGQLIYDGESD